MFAFRSPNGYPDVAVVMKMSKEGHESSMEKGHKMQFHYIWILEVLPQKEVERRLINLNPKESARQSFLTRLEVLLILATIWATSRADRFLSDHLVAGFNTLQLCLQAAAHIP
ncbi:unnamed protein product [Caenorhabditis auriculariae]|uniref:Uncharacterized protein n=1 Tax=Caenorhabditis auriculariae TaxID=2777116 RepID=A0A8S1HEU1_9PELO|nr:unnamed protein product [Caenorhabditis auriculariae]